MDDRIGIMDMLIGYVAVASSYACIPIVVASEAIGNSRSIFDASCVRITLLEGVIMHFSEAKQTDHSISRKML